jgi:RNA polymerase sigma-70 factor (ECF subfamily)
VAARGPAQSLGRTDLGALYDEHAAALYRLLLAMLGSPDDAQDVLSEVFLAVARQDLRRIGNLRVYLLAAARNRAVSVLRRRKREVNVEPTNPCFIDLGRVDTRDQLLAHAVEDALRDLPADQREVIALKVYEGLTFAEIAAITHTPPNTVASRYRYAIEKLRRALRELSGNE